MSEAIRVLILGEENWQEEKKNLNLVNVEYSMDFQDKVIKPYDIVIIMREPSKDEFPYIYEATKEYCFFVVEDIALENELKQLFIRKKGKRLDRSKINIFLQEEAENFFSESYGEKFSFQNFSISQKFHGKVQWKGNYSVALEGDFGKNFRQIAFWRNNIPIQNGQALELWLEYNKEKNVEIILTVIHFTSGTLAEIEQKWIFTEEEMKNPIIIDNRRGFGPLFVYLSAKGEGYLEIIALHDRYSRRGHGYFIPGGERYVTSNREEIFAYFNPGDLKPPLHIYFSGYKTKQGFEGYHLMKSMKSPFLLISECRLEGGNFYLGSNEYEELLIKIIKKYSDQLGFSSKDIIMSGLSMGTFGALYYGADILPHAILLGKPLTSIGDIANNERWNRPGGFPTSLDVFQYAKKCFHRHTIDEVNKIFWEKLEKVCWGETKFVISYMIEDDYDSNSYHNLISSLDSKGIQIYGKGIHGRHNDNTYEIVQWYKGQLQKILVEDYNRELD